VPELVLKDIGLLRSRLLRRPAIGCPRVPVEEEEPAEGYCCDRRSDQCRYGKATVSCDRSLDLFDCHDGRDRWSDCHGDSLSRFAG
jgi:hypothetical protein